MVVVDGAEAAAVAGGFGGRAEAAAAGGRADGGVPGLLLGRGVPGLLLGRGVPGLLLGRGVPGLLPAGEAPAEEAPPEEGGKAPAVAAAAVASDSGPTLGAAASGGVAARPVLRISAVTAGPTGDPVACAGSSSAASPGSSCTRTTQQSWSFSNTVTSEPSQSCRGMRESHMCRE